MNGERAVTRARAGAILLASVGLAVLSGGCGRTDAPVGEKSWAADGPAPRRFDAAELPGTVVTAHLDEPIGPGRNVLWCATFQLAWNELMDYAGGPVTMPGGPGTVDVLNRRDVARDQVDEASCVAIAGRMDEGTLQAARKEMARKFPGVAPDLLDQARILPPDGVMLYAYLARQMPFEHAFKRDEGFRFLPTPDADYESQPELASLGIWLYPPDSPGAARTAKQVQILYHRFVEAPNGDLDQHFVVELLTKAKQDRLILALVPPKQTLAQTVSEVMKRVDRPNTAVPAGPEELDRLARGAADEGVYSRYSCMLPLEAFRAPVLDFNIRREFKELYGRKVVARDRRVNGLPFVLTLQQIRFRLDERGAVLKSEAVGGLFGGPPRRFDFDRPFLILMMRKGAAKPYFALWVGNSELLVKAPAATPTTQPEP